MNSYRNQFDLVTDSVSGYNRTGYGNYPERYVPTNPSQRPESYNDLATYNNQSKLDTYSYYKSSRQVRSKSGLVKLQQFRRRVHEVVDLCKGENNDVKSELNQVINEERKIYEMLNQNSSLLRKSISQQNFPVLPQNPQSSQRREQLTTPFRQPKTPHVPQSQYVISSLSQVGARDNLVNPTFFQSNVRRPESIYMPQQDLVNQPYVQNPSQNMQGSINKIKPGRQTNLSEDALRMIEQIERKANDEIQKLRREKLELMQKLNQEIKNLNDQRRKNAELQNLVNRFAIHLQRPDGSGENTQYLQAQIQRLETELQRTNQINNNLRLQLANKGAGVPGMQELLRQGQAIRQQTLRLLKIKDQGEGNIRIQQLERMLAAERSQKESALNEVRVLKERQGDQGQLRNYQPTYAYDKPSARMRPIQQVRTVGQYQDLVSQMKRITGF